MINISKDNRWYNDIENQVTLTINLMERRQLNFYRNKIFNILKTQNLKSTCLYSYFVTGPSTLECSKAKLFIFVDSFVRAGVHVTFVYGNKIPLIYIDRVPGNQIPIPGT